ncbi:GtrA family protein [Pseudonocardia nematodicida]|uniref:GtrA family protein n=1 Tax=Pseudonocardia nematodicida TaxID=1206997 RepID=A0ABV1KIA1_9PSEU
MNATTSGAGERPAPDAVVGTHTGVRTRMSAALRHPLVDQLGRYAAVGGVATGLNAALFLLFRPWLAAVPANLLALILTTALSTELSRRFAFGGAPAHRLREWVQDIGTVAFYACYTSAVLLALQWVATPSPREEAAALVVASLAGGLLRFAVLRFWVFDLRARAVDDTTSPGGDEPCTTTSRPSI